MTHKYFDGKVPEVDPKVEKEFELQSDAMRTIAEFEQSMETFEFHKALAAVWGFIGQMNKYVDVNAPWVLAKKKSSRKALETVIYNLLEGLRIISGLIYPVMPGTAATMQKHLGLDATTPYYHLDRLKQWKSLACGTNIPKSVILFPRIDPAQTAPETPAPQKANPANLNVKPEVTIEDFNKIDLRVATIMEAERVPKAKKLLKLKIDLGQKRTIVAGIAENYSPEKLVGKQIIVVANLRPAKLMGILSDGMLLAAVDDNGVTLATLDKPVEPGTPLK
jgi:methionyl-tRNA synthetase